MSYIDKMHSGILEESLRHQALHQAMRKAEKAADLIEVTVYSAKINEKRQDLAYQLYNARQKAGMTQQELADKSGISRAVINRAEGRRSNPNLTTLLLLADVLQAEIKIIVSAN